MLAVVAAVLLAAPAALLPAAGAAQRPAPGQAQAGPRAGASLTLLTPEGRRPLAVTRIGGRDMVSLDDLASIFPLTVREDQLAGGLTVAWQGQTIVLTPSQPLVSVAGRLVTLPAGPVRDGRAWLVPVEFIPRALGPISPAPIDLRLASRLVIVGDLRVPRIAVRRDLLGGQARLSFDIEPPARHTIVRDGSRLLVRFEADALDVTLPSDPPGDFVEAVRVEPPNAIAVHLGPQAATFRTSDQPEVRGAARLIVDLLAARAEAEPEAPAAPSAPSPALPLPAFGAAAGLRTIVIDPGHGGDEAGARGPNGTLEKDVTLSVARRLRSAIESRLGIRVILTRDGDQTVRLDERAAVANNNKADLFISLHTNAAARGSAAGAEVFYLSLEEYGDLARRAADRHPEALPVVGGGTRQIEIILWEMAQARYLQESAAFARIVEAQLRPRVPMSPRPLQRAPFRVLVGANMPAVLVEMGFISNPQQERELASDAFQGAIVQGLLESVVRFRDHVIAGSRHTAQPADPGPAAPAAGGPLGSLD